jgi:hypothetical protein
LKSQEYREKRENGWNRNEVEKSWKGVLSDEGGGWCIAWR